MLTFQPAETQLGSIVLGQDELVMLVHPSHPLAHSREVTLSECARQTVIAHNDPSHVRDRVLRLFEQHHIPLISRLTAAWRIQRAVEIQMGVAMLRGAAGIRIVRGELVALAMPEVRCGACAAGIPQAGDRSTRDGVPGINGKEEGHGGTTTTLRTEDHEQKKPRKTPDPTHRDTEDRDRKIFSCSLHRCQYDSEICSLENGYVRQRAAAASHDRSEFQQHPEYPAPDCVADVGGSENAQRALRRRCPRQIRVTSAVGRFSITSIKARTSAGVAVRQGIPIITELPKKISANDSPITASMPQRCSPCGACSRDDPHPKFEFTTRIFAP